MISAHGCWTSLKRSNCRSEERAGCLENYVDLEQEGSTATSQPARLLNFKDLDEKKEKFEFWGSTMLVVYQVRIYIFCELYSHNFDLESS